MTLLIRNFAFLAPWFIIILPASQRRIRDLGKMHFSRIPHFSSAVFTSGENPQEFSRNKNAGKMDIQISERRRIAVGDNFSFSI